MIRNTMNSTTMPMGISALAQSGFSASLLFFIAAFAPGQNRNRTPAARIPTSICSNSSMNYCNSEPKIRHLEDQK